MNALTIGTALAVVLLLVVTFSLRRVGWRAARGWLIAWATPVVVLLVVVGSLRLLWLEVSYLSSLNRDPAGTSIEYIRSLAETLGIAAAAVFLVIKLAAGYGFSNAKLTTITTRSPLSRRQDLLVVTTCVASGAARSFQLLDVVMVALDPETGSPREPLAVSGFKKNGVFASRLSEQEVAAPLSLNPGDSIEVAGWLVVPREAVVPVKIAVLSVASTALTTEQWTSAIVSAPRARSEH